MMIERDVTGGVRGLAMLMSQRRRRRGPHETSRRYSCGSCSVPGDEGTGAPRPLLGVLRLAVCPSVYLLILLMLPFALEEAGAWCKSGPFLAPPSFAHMPSFCPPMTRHCAASRTIHTRRVLPPCASQC